MGQAKTFHIVFETNTPSLPQMPCSLLHRSPKTQTNYGFWHHD